MTKSRGDKGDLPRKPRTARGERTRKRLIDAAEALFGSAGYHDTGVTDITRRARVAQGTFYLYFESKEALFRELVSDLNHRLRMNIARSVQGLDDRLLVEEAGLRSFLAFAAEHRNLYRIVFESQFMAPDLFRWYYERLAEGYREGLDRAMEKGQVASMDAETVAYALMGAAHFMGMRWVVWEGKEPPDEVFATLRTFIRGALTPGATREVASKAGSGGSTAHEE